ncbi:helix-hairpin-helix domain-containing protein [Limibacter armeniacum]|uniref:ComEA family DNA-binding protein n=1 Tax=Limibacter armeniacum TaxID=466084 RepID=UPI002FE533A7
MQNIHQWLRNYFGWSYRERNGFIVLMPLTVLFLVFPMIFSKVSVLFIEDHSESDRILLDSLVAVIESQKHIQEPPAYFVFDPNEIVEAEWIKLGVSERLANRIVNYRSKGGRFYKKSDLKKIYGFPDTLYKELEPFILLAAKENKTLKADSAPTKTRVEYFNFNPNTLSKEGWEKLGVRSYIAERILKYRAKGGRFYVKKDLQKIYGFPEKTYQMVSSYIDLPDSLPRAKIKEKRLDLFDINKVKKEELVTLKGIGEKTAARIIKYRNLLGGSFYSLSQLEEVWGIQAYQLEKLQQHALLDTIFIKKISINQVDERTLSKHPYVEHKIAERIIRFRRQHGPFKGFTDLLNIKEVNEKDLKRVQPYLCY